MVNPLEAAHLVRNGAHPDDVWPGADPMMRAWLFRQMPRARAAAGAKPDGPLADVIILQADGCYRIGDWPPVRIDTPEDQVLRAFLDASALALPALKKASRHDRAHETLKRLSEKYDGRFAPAIHRPGGKGKGGYRVAIQREQAGGGAAH